ncbi:KGG domain-containing protein [Pseudoduganella lutea]|uniref:Stress-induced protein n=1 Tax=Pseudoduganella lutea TaxID=321985 RepID=A0A4P6L192_9BURK|nr:KGG domain-containing protein [Pseudoduganella lutea]QBE65229.1 stress-induced protein [Pseudoduganella lutea]
MASSNQGNNQGGNKGSKQSGDTSNRGFASMDPQRQREIASEGGRAAHASGNAHEFTSEEARKAGSMSHKNDGNRQSGSQGSSGGGNQGNQGSSGGGTRGGTPEQHAQAGRQSHKNDKG